MLFHYRKYDGSINNVQFVIAKSQLPIRPPPSIHWGERSHFVSQCDRLRVIKPSCTAAPAGRIIYSIRCPLTSEQCNLLPSSNEVLLTNARCQCERELHAPTNKADQPWEPQKVANVRLKQLFTLNF